MIICGDSLEVLKTLDANSVDAVVTDPPYGLSFMGKKWDYDVPSTDLWIEVLRVLKPGGHLLSFGGTRTYHRMCVAIEDAGFDIRDQIQWLYGSGFPKSLDVSKACDKHAEVERDVIGQWSRSGDMAGGNMHALKNNAGVVKTGNITAPATPDAIRWQGFGTALKPANEPIVLARKPLSESTVAKNVLRWGCGALNIDGSRIGANPGYKYPNGPGGNSFSVGNGVDGSRVAPVESTQGRWPANVLFDEEAAAMLDEQSGLLQSRPNKNPRPVGEFTFVNQKDPERERQQYETSKGGASRFFYVAKASKRERNAGLEGMPLGELPKSARSKPADGRETALGLPRANHHPTVKPIKLMEYLCKLITPAGGTILDPFCGSGSTGVAAVRLGFKFIGIEREKEYCEIANKRLEHASKKDEQLEL